MSCPRQVNQNLSCTIASQHRMCVCTRVERERERETDKRQARNRSQNNYNIEEVRTCRYSTFEKFKARFGPLARGGGGGGWGD